MPHQLSPSDFLFRIQELARVAGVQTARPASRCWVHADISCPYGSPEGQFELRPTAFCHNGCPHFPDGMLTEEEAQEKAREALGEEFNSIHTTFTKQLREIARELPDKAEEMLLDLAADLIEEKKLDHDIALRKDLPE